MSLRARPAESRAPVLPASGPIPTWSAVAGGGPSVFAAWSPAAGVARAGHHRGVAQGGTGLRSDLHGRVLVVGMGLGGTRADQATSTVPRNGMEVLNVS